MSKFKQPIALQASAASTLKVRAMGLALARGAIEVLVGRVCSCGNRAPRGPPPADDSEGALPLRSDKRTRRTVNRRTHKRSIAPIISSS